MTGRSGILAYGAYIPRRRLQRAAIHSMNSWFAPALGGLAKGEKAISGWDEDSITMAVEAARDCLSGLDRASVDAIALASTTFPFADRQNAGIAKEALNLRDDIRSLDFGGSLRAGVSALADALASDTTKLCLASDRRKARPGSEAEMQIGDAAAGILVGQGAIIANCLGSHSETIDFVDHFRATGEDFDYHWESRWIRDEGYVAILGETVKSALRGFDVEPKAIDHSVIAVPARRAPETICKIARLSPDSVSDPLVSTVGDAGTAHPLLMLAAALEKAKPGEKILLAGFGQGVEVLLFETTDKLLELSDRKGVAGHLAEREADENYGRYLFHRGLLEMERGMRAEADEKQPGSVLARNRKEVLGLVGGKCTKTGAVQFPKSVISVAQNERAANTLEDYCFAERPAAIVSHTSDMLTYSPNPPCHYGMIDFEGGGRMTVEFVDANVDEVTVGREVRMVFRIKAEDELRNFTRYFWKAAIVR